MGIANEILQGQDKEGMLRRALERIIQLYTDKSHFVYELLQNAEDVGASKIKFLQYSDRLEVLHDGHPFSKKNLQGLCDIGKSDKINDLNQIGEFGVGFKSVFGICEKVQLYSHPEREDPDKGYSQFAIEIIDFTHPVDIEDKEIDAGYTTKFNFPYNVGSAFSGFTTVDELNEVLSKRLQNLGITTLLFMKNLKSIDYDIELPTLKTSGSYILDKKTISDRCSLVSAVGEVEKNEEESVSYLIFSCPVKGMQAGRTIDIAFTVTVEETGEYSFKVSKAPYISVYFPTETESKLKFIVQGPYRTTPNRSSVPADNKENIELAKQTAQLLRESVLELRDNGKLNLTLLRILPIEKDIFENAPLFKGMFDVVKVMMGEEEVLPCKDGNYASADCVKIARGSDLTEVLTDELLTELLDDGTKYHWLPTVLTETSKDYNILYIFLTDVLDIDVLRPESLRNHFNKNQKFLMERDDEWLVKLYNMYSGVAAAFSKQRGGANMLTAEFIKTSMGRFAAPYRKSDGCNLNRYRGYESAEYLPNIFLPCEMENEIEDIHFVDNGIYEHCKNFFTEILALQKPDEYEFFIREFKKHYSNNPQFTEEQHIKDVKNLLRYRDNADYRGEIDGLISKYLVLKCVKNGKPVYINPKSEEIFFSVTSSGMSIEQYYKHIEVYAYVDADFYKVNGISDDMLRIMGVSDNIARGAGVVKGEYYTSNPGRQPEWKASVGFRWKLTLDCLGAVLAYIEKNPMAADAMAKSSFIFKFLQSNEASLSGHVYVGGSYPDFPNAHSEIVEILKRGCVYGFVWTGKWLYTKSGDLVSQREISKRDLNIQLYGEIRSDSKLYEILGFGKNKAEKLEEAEKDYDELTDERKNQYFEIELKRRYGISTTDLEEKYGSNSSGSNHGSRTAYVQQEIYEFPSSKVKNWELLRKHAAEALCFAVPVKYEYVTRHIRISKPASVRAYLMNMYKVDSISKYACQMCYEPYGNVEACQIKNELEVELEPMNLCLCPNCAAKYKKMRADENGIERFMEDIAALKNHEIELFDPVKVEFGNEIIWFTQTHIAEIRELMDLKEAD